ncbi:MAG: hypothetical protein AAFZ15_12415 [Bacteroidota bacterium]
MNSLTFTKKIDYLFESITQRWGIQLLRYSLALVYIWFGILKPLGMSPASGLVEETVFWFSADWFVPALGFWEVLIGVLLLFSATVRLAVIMIFIHLPCTFLPFLTAGETAAADTVFQLTLVGQYIVKNFTLLVAALIIGGSVNRKQQLVKTAEAKKNNPADVPVFEKEFSAN